MSKDIDFGLMMINAETKNFLMGREPTNKLYITILELIRVLKRERKIIKSAFNETPEVYENISDQVVGAAMAGLIHLVNKPGERGETNRYYYRALKNLGSFKMSQETRKKYKENMRVIHNNESVEAQNAMMQGYSQSQSSSDCYIATMVYKDHDHPKVIVLRNFRDVFLSKYFFGRVFIRFYYKYSPSLVELLKDKKAIRKMIEKILNGIIKLIDENGSVQRT
mgnify:CR=1 FL=1